jgi:hypothetical protein
MIEFSLREILFETVSGRISLKWTQWGNIPQIENASRIVSLYGKNRMFSSRGIFHGTASTSENPIKIPWGFMFENEIS